MAEERKYCVFLRTKMGYFRAPDGSRMIDPDSSTACYTCLQTQRPYGPDGMPCDAESCGENRACFREDS